jgi:hypothetical protein
MNRFKYRESKHIDTNFNSKLEKKRRQSDCSNQQQQHNIFFLFFFYFFCLLSNMNYYAIKIKL